MEKDSILKAGYAEQIVTPPLGEKIPGYFATRFAEGKLTDLLIRATAFDDGENKAVIFSCDAISIDEAAYGEISALIEETCGIPANFVYIHATHSHTAYRIVTSVEGDPIYNSFYPHLLRMFADCAKLALEDLAPASFRIARGKAEGISFNRRYEKKDGTFKTNPKTGDPDLVRFAGPVNETVQLLRILREDAKEILFVNFGTHPDTIGDCLYHYDWPGYTVDFLRNTFGGKVNAMLLNGAQGDVNHCNRFADANKSYHGSEVAERMARVIVGEVLKIYDTAIPVPAGKIHAYKKPVKIGKNTFDPATLPLAEEIYKHYQESLVTGVRDEFLTNPDLRRIPQEGNRAMSIPEAVRIIATLDAPDFFEFYLTGLQIGGIGLIGIPGEPFTQIGIDIQKESTLDMTIINCLVNGSRGYFPTADAFAVAGYERSTSRFAHNCAEIVINGGREIVSEMIRNNA